MKKIEKIEKLDFSEVNRKEPITDPNEAFQNMRESINILADKVTELVEAVNKLSQTKK